MESARSFASKGDSDGYPHELSSIMGKSDLESSMPLVRGKIVEEGSLQNIAELARKVSDSYRSILLHTPHSAN